GPRPDYPLSSRRCNAERGGFIVHRRNFGFRTLAGFDQTLHSRPICLGLILAPRPLCLVELCPPVPLPVWSEQAYQTASCALAGRARASKFGVVPNLGPFEHCQGFRHASFPQVAPQET